MPAPVAAPSIAMTARLLSSGATTARALIEAALTRIEAENPGTRVFIATCAEAALGAADDSDRRRAVGASLGPLDGVPVAVKDNIDVEGMATTGGTRHRFAAPADAGVVRRLRAAGAVILGKLNMHEGALGATTDNPFWGRCDNPAVPGHTPGGSSGGSGAAVAAGLVPLALGTDTMGSVRIPAAYCGVWGLKPTRGLFATSGLLHLSWTLDTIGPLANAAEDLAVCAEAMAGFDRRDPRSVAPPPGWSAALDTALSPGQITLGTVDPAALAECEPRVLAAYQGVLGRLRGAGVALEPVTVAGWEPGAARRAGLLVSEAECASLLGETLDRYPGDFSEGFRKMLDYGRKAPAERLARAYWLFDELRASTLAALDGLDGIVMPTTPQHAFPHGAPAPANQADFTAIANIAGLPCVSFPLGVAPGEPPAAAQIMGKPFAESRILSIARLLA